MATNPYTFTYTTDYGTLRLKPMKSMKNKDLKRCMQEESAVESQFAMIELMLNPEDMGTFDELDQEETMELFKAWSKGEVDVDFPKSSQSSN